MTFDVNKLKPGPYTLICEKNGIATVMEDNGNNGVLLNRYWIETGELLFEQIRLH